VRAADPHHRARAHRRGRGRTRWPEAEKPLPARSSWEAERRTLADKIEEPKTSAAARELARFAGGSPPGTRRRGGHGSWAAQGSGALTVEVGWKVEPGSASLAAALGPLADAVVYAEAEGALADARQGLSWRSHRADPCRSVPRRTQALSEVEAESAARHRLHGAARRLPSRPRWRKPRPSRPRIEPPRSSRLKGCRRPGRDPHRQKPTLAPARSAPTSRCSRTTQSATLNNPNPKQRD
jgi:hypothetical protein